tara:strand:- start:202 stop:366 length:165 start_codon:yes stop_codon:yes gene_type:complete
MPSINMDNGTTAEALEAALAADNCAVKPAPVVKEEAPAPKAKAKASKTESKLSE